MYITHRSGYSSFHGPQETIDEETEADPFQTTSEEKTQIDAGHARDRTAAKVSDTTIQTASAFTAL